MSNSVRYFDTLFNFNTTYRVRRVGYINIFELYVSKPFPCNIGVVVNPNTKKYKTFFCIPMNLNFKNLQTQKYKYLCATHKHFFCQEPNLSLINCMVTVVNHSTGRSMKIMNQDKFNFHYVSSVFFLNQINPQVTKYSHLLLWTNRNTVSHGWTCTARFVWGYSTYP